MKKILCDRKRCEIGVDLKEVVRKSEIMLFFCLSFYCMSEGNSIYGSNWKGPIYPFSCANKEIDTYLITVLIWTFVSPKSSQEFFQ